MCGSFLNILSFDPVDWDRQLAVADSLEGLDHLEVWLEWIPESRVELRSVQRILDGRKVTFHGPFVGMSLVSPWDELRQISEARIARACEVASSCGARSVTVHSGSTFFTTNHSQALDWLASSLERLTKDLDSIDLLIENMMRRAGVMYEPVVAVNDMRSLIERYPDVRFTLDVGHAIQSGLDPGGMLSAIGSSLSNIHLHDGISAGQAHLELGAGELDLDQFVQDLVRSDYRGLLSLEVLTVEALIRSWEVLETVYSRRM